MESTDTALRGTAATPELWHAVYMMLVFALLARGLHALPLINARPFGWETGLQVAVDLLICPAPLVAGLAFKKRLKTELGMNLMGLRAFKICDFRIALVVILAYIAMVL